MSSTEYETTPYVFEVPDLSEPTPQLYEADGVYHYIEWAEVDEPASSGDVWGVSTWEMADLYSPAYQEPEFGAGFGSDSSLSSRRKPPAVSLSPDVPQSTSDLADEFIHEPTPEPTQASTPASTPPSSLFDTESDDVDSETDSTGSDTDSDELESSQPSNY